MQTLQVIKTGGHIIDDVNSLDIFLQKFAGIAGPKILVHGGGKIASRFAQKMDIPQRMVEGRRITDAATLDIAVMVYAGLVNKKIVASLQALSCNAIGLTGADGGLIKSNKRKVTAIDYGFVGDIEQVNASLLSGFIKEGTVPVFSAITHDGQGQLLNTNADTLAAAIAVALSPFYKVSLHYCFEKSGVLQDPLDDASAMATIKRDRYVQLKNEGVISAGMIPKLDHAFHALENGVMHVAVGNALSIGANLWGTQLAI